MKIIIAGGSGFIGSTLTKELVSLGHNVVILTRNPHSKEDSENITYLPWLKSDKTPIAELEDADAFVNLAGESLSNGRWTPKKKEEILQSRLDSTEEIVRIITSLKNKPSVLLNASAIGYYGTSLTASFTEESQVNGNDFLAQVVSEWESTASQAANNTRVVYTRFGIVLDKNEGALSKMLLPFKFFIGGKLGSGQQWMSWIHKDDLVAGIVYCLENEAMEGVVNFTAPNPVKMSEFSQVLAKVMSRPNWIPVPGFVLKIILGEMSILVIEGQRVLPNKLIDSSFTFQYTDLHQALSNLLKEKK